MTGFSITLLVIFIFLLILLLCPVTISYSYDGKQFLNIKYLFFKLNILPKHKKNNKKNKDTETKKKIKKTDKNKKSKFGKTVKNTLKIIKDNLSVSELILLFIYILKKCCLFLKRLVKIVIIKQFKLYVKISGEDAADTALKYGKYNGYIYSTLKFFDQFFTFKQMDVEIVPDFNADKSCAAFNTKVSVLPILLIFITLLYLISCIKLYFKLKKQTKIQTKEA